MYPSDSPFTAARRLSDPTCEYLMVIEMVACPRSSWTTRIKAAVPFYGQAPSEEEIKNIHCQVLAFYGDQDVNLMQSLPKLKEDMQTYGKQFEAVVYQNAGHAFFNDTNLRAYNPEAAKDSCEKTLSFLKLHCAF